jgi:hypothetical protein
MSSELVLQQQELARAIRTHSVTATGNLLKNTLQGTPARLDIYSIAYRARLGEALKENYPVLARVLGDDGFADLANAFLQQYPSRTPSIRWFGARLAEFTEQASDALPHPALVDLIRMEWALNTAFDAADAVPLKVDELLRLAPEDWPALQFALHPSLHLLLLNWAIEPLWSALSVDENAETDAPEEFAHHLLIWRVEHRTQWRSVSADEARLLDAAIAANTFAQLCEIAAEFAGDNAAATVAGYLRNWVEADMLTGFTA